MSDQIQRGMREMGFFEAILPGDELRHNQAMRRTVDEAGRIAPEAARPFRLPLTFDWGPSDLTRHRVPRAGDLVLIGIHATTPPSGTCEVTVTMQTTSGVVGIAKARLPVGSDQIDVPLDTPQQVLAGSRLHASVTTVGGASGVSISAEIQAG